VRRISEQDFLNSIHKTDKRLQTAQMCEAHFFIGQQKILSGNSKVATKHFQMVLETNAKHLSAYRGAQFALNQF